MEALGAAASVVGVVSITLQLIETVRDVHSFLSDISEAPEEIERLVDSLALLDGALQDVKNFAEMQLLQENTPTMPSNMNHILKSCKKNLEPLKTIIEKAQTGFRSSHRIVRKWASLNVANSKKDIKALEDRILLTIQLLTMSMVVNMNRIGLSSHNNINVLVASAQESCAIMNFSSLTEIPDDSKTQLSSHVKSRHMHHRILRYGRLQFSSSTNELISADNKTSSKSSLSFGQKKTCSVSARFLRYYFHWQLSTGSGWKHSFRVYQVVSEDDLVWDLCRKSDILGLQQLFSEGRQSPFIKNRDGGTLIHHCATMNDQAETIKFLGGLGVDMNLEDDRGFLPLQSTWALDVCQELIHHGQTDPVMIGSGNFVYDPETAFWILTQQDFYVEPKAHFPFIVHHIASRMRLGYHHAPPMQLERLVSYLFKIGFNLSSINDRGQTPLDFLFEAKCLPRELESQSLGQQWLMLLSSIKVDVEAYLMNEKSIHSDGFITEGFKPFYCTRRRYKFTTGTDQFPTVSWEWVIPPETPAFLLLAQFKTICLEAGAEVLKYSDRFCEEPRHFGTMRRFPYDETIHYLKTIRKRKIRSARKAELRERRRARFKIPREYRPGRRGRPQPPGFWIENNRIFISQPKDVPLSVPKWLIMSLIGLIGHLLFHVLLTQFSGTQSDYQ